MFNTTTITPYFDPFVFKKENLEDFDQSLPTNLHVKNGICNVDDSRTNTILSGVHRHAIHIADIAGASKQQFTVPTVDLTQHGIIGPKFGSLFILMISQLLTGDAAVLLQMQIDTTELVTCRIEATTGKSCISNFSLFDLKTEFEVIEAA